MTQVNQNMTQANQETTGNLLRAPVVVEYRNPPSYPSMVGLGLYRSVFDFNDTRIWHAISRAYEVFYASELVNITRYEDDCELWTGDGPKPVLSDYLTTQERLTLDQCPAACDFLGELAHTIAPRLACVWLAQHADDGQYANINFPIGRAVEAWLDDFVDCGADELCSIKDADGN